MLVIVAVMVKIAGRKCHTLHKHSILFSCSSHFVLFETQGMCDHYQLGLSTRASEVTCISAMSAISSLRFDKTFLVKSLKTSEWDNL